MQLNTKKYDAFVRTLTIMRAGVKLIAIEEVRNYRKLYALKTFKKMVGGRRHNPHPTPLNPPLAISYRTIKRVWHISVTWHH